MSKAILVIDMPACCDYCQLSAIAHDSDLYEEGECYCIARLESVDSVPEGSKPEWCPLRELPEKRTDIELDSMQDYERAQAEGYNFCVDKFLG